MRVRTPRALLAALLVAAAQPAAAIFDDNVARERIEALRRQFEAAQAAQRSLEERLTQLQANAAERRAILDLAGQIEAFRGELARMRGQIEVLVNQGDTAEKRQKDLYLDIDTRLRKLEQASAAAAAKPPPADDGASEAEKKVYEAALNQFKLGNYPLAISTLQGLLVTYPGTKLAPNAQYWIGMGFAGQRDYKNAIVEHQKVLASFPEDPKAPDAMLGIASAQEAMGDRRSAQKTLEGLILRYPASAAAATARQRLPQGAKK
jgi:tol-pal system protein YbgF